MAFAVWDVGNFLELSYGHRDVLPVKELLVGPPHRREVVQLAPLARRVYTATQKRTAAEREVVEAFLVEARRMGVEPFLFKDPLDHARTGVALTVVAGLVYTLPTLVTNEDYRHYPIDDANVQVYDGGLPVAHTAVGTDARTITLAAPPGGAVTADFHAYRLVRLEGRALEWTFEGPALWGGAPVFHEVLREDDPFPYA